MSELKITQTTILIFHDLLKMNTVIRRGFIFIIRKKLMKWTKRIVIGWFFGAVLRMPVRVAASLVRTRIPIGRTRLRLSALALL